MAQTTEGALKLLLAAHSATRDTHVCSVENQTQNSNSESGTQTMKPNSLERTIKKLAEINRRNARAAKREAILRQERRLLDTLDTDYLDEINRQGEEIDRILAEYR